MTKGLDLRDSTLFCTCFLLFFLDPSTARPAADWIISSFRCVPKEKYCGIVPPWFIRDCRV